MYILLRTLVLFHNRNDNVKGFISVILQASVSGQIIVVNLINDKVSLSTSYLTDVG